MSGRNVLLGLLVLLAAGCGGAKSPAVASVADGTTTSHTAGTGATTTTAATADPALAYARCMRANGVKSFPDPSSAGGFVIPVGSGFDPSSPAFKAAQARCRRFTPDGLLKPGTTTHPTAQWLAQMVKAAACMRRHGLAGFPDPATTVPPMPTAGRAVISDIDGVIFEFTGSIDPESPAFVRAAKACGFPTHNH